MCTLFYFYFVLCVHIRVHVKSGQGLLLHVAQLVSNGASCPTLMTQGELSCLLQASRGEEKRASFSHPYHHMAAEGEQSHTAGSCGGLFSIEVPSLQITLVCINLTEE